jgi:hypothetical protein
MQTVNSRILTFSSVQIVNSKTTLFAIYCDTTMRSMDRRALCLLALVAVSWTLSAGKDDSDDDDKKKESVGTVIGIDLGTTYSWLVSFK